MKKLLTRLPRPGPPLWGVILLLFNGLGLIGVSLGLMLRDPQPGTPTRWTYYSGAMQMVRQCPDGGAIYRTDDGRWFEWRQGWTERRIGAEPLKGCQGPPGAAP